MADNKLLAFYYLNTNLLVIKNARSARAGGGILNGATGTVEVLDKVGNLVPNGGSVALTYIPASQGRYEALLSALIPTPPGSFLKLRVNLNGGPNLVYRAILEARVLEAP